MRGEGLGHTQGVSSPKCLYQLGDLFGCRERLDSTGSGSALAGSDLGWVYIDTRVKLGQMDSGRFDWLYSAELVRPIWAI